MILGVLKGILSSGIVGSLERVASEAIETQKETAEARALYVKVLDPNGKMRRDLSRFASRAYAGYLIVTSFLIIIHAFNLGDQTASKEAVEAITALFTPITTAWGAIVSASFGVNGVNSIREPKETKKVE